MWSDYDPIFEEFTMQFDKNIQTSKILMTGGLNGHKIEQTNILR